MEIPLFNDIVIIFVLAIVVLLLCHRLRIPAIVGFLITGVLAGPHGLRLIERVHEVEILAEIGVVLLLFTIGLEFSLKDLLRIKKSVLMGGSLQVVLTIVAAFVGSNIANILLILGISGIIYPIKTAKNTVWKEIPFALLSAGVLLVLCNDLLLNGAAREVISRSDGIVLILFFVTFFSYVFGISNVEGHDTLEVKIMSGCNNNRFD